MLGRRLRLAAGDRSSSRFVHELDVSYNTDDMSVRFVKSSAVRPVVSMLLAIVALGIGASYVRVAKLPTVGSMLKADSKELAGRRWTIPGERGFWVSYPVRPEGSAVPGGGADITWPARKGLVPTVCRLTCLFDTSWGSPLSTIEGGSWRVDRSKYTMSGRLYLHYMPVPPRSPGSVAFRGQTYAKVGAMCVGDFTRVR